MTTLRQRLRHWFLALMAVTTSPVAAAEPEPDPAPPRVLGASEEARQAIARFRVPQGYRIELFAAEPRLANPVAFALDERNRAYVAETYRVHAGVTDNRNHPNWVDRDLANRTTADRLAMFRDDAGAKFLDEYGRSPDQIRFVEDRDGDGRADHSDIFAGGFHHPEDGIGSSVLVRGKDVWYTNIPHLWHFRDEDGDGKADHRQSLHEGYGIHVALLGHDSHGLTWGPDGRIYYSVGDRAANISLPNGQSVTNLESGSVFRCEPDGSNLEIFATGLRNPQDLAFNDLGDLFTVDNNSDSGDEARVVRVVEGSDSGWRVGFQSIETPNSRGVWNSEDLWHPRQDGQPAYLMPPLANLSDGPAGLAIDPGTGFPASERGRAYLADFRGTAGDSGIRSFALKPDGASYKVEDPQEFLWSILATDCVFGTDGALYVADWVEGWDGAGKGRLYKLLPEMTDPRTAEVQRLIAEGFDHRPIPELLPLLAHPDRRVRLAAQFAIAGKGGAAEASLTQTAQSSKNPLARMHALWALGQIARNSKEPRHERFSEFFHDPDPEIRAQALRTLADTTSPATRPVADNRASADLSQRISLLLADESPRVRLFAGLALNHVGTPEAIEPLLQQLDADFPDPVLRHAAVMGLVGSARTESRWLSLNPQDPPAPGRSPNVRLGLVLFCRRTGHPALARFLDDPDPQVVSEAARAIADVAASPEATAHLAEKLAAGHPDLFLRRAIRANLRVGGLEAAARLVALANSAAPEPLRVEALNTLATWATPPGRDTINGLWRPIEPHPVEQAAEALKPTIAPLLSSVPDPVRTAAAHAAGVLQVSDANGPLATLAADPDRPGPPRVAALQALATLNAPGLAESVRAAVASTNADLRSAGRRLLAKIDPADAARVLEIGLAHGSVAERQSSLSTLGDLPHPRADQILGDWLDDLLADKVPPSLRLDLLEAAAKRQDPAIHQKLARFEAARPVDDPFGPYRESLEGGDAQRGQAIFTTRAEAECVRCHRLRQGPGAEGVGGDVGPELTGVGARNDRAYLLESIVAPNRQIAKGFETIVLALDDGRTIAGVVKSDNGKTLQVQTPDGKVVEVSSASIEGRTTGLSGMPQDLVKHLSRSDVRDLVEFLSTLKN